MKRVLFVFFIFISLAIAKSGEDISKELKLNPASKAQKQWDRIFGDVKKMQKMEIDKLSEDDKKNLLEYLKSHAADSDSPTVPGL